MFDVGDYVVKINNGVCKIEERTQMDITGKKEDYYRLTPLADAGAKIYVPVEKIGDSARAVLTKERAEQLIEKIPGIDETWISNEKERERRYKEELQCNDPEKLVGIIKLIYQRKKTRSEQGKKTTAVDERYFALAEKLLYAELELVLEKDKEEVYQMIRECCEKKA